MPGLTGTEAGDELMLRITFDTGAPPIGQREFPDGGRSFSFDGSSLVLVLKVPGGKHVFRIDDDAPSGIHSSIAVFDDVVLAPEPARDGLEFKHAYLTPEGEIDFTVFASFFTTDTTLLDGAHLPLAPDPRLADGVTREISITDARSASGGLLGIFFSLVRVDLPEAGTLSLLSLGLCALGVLERRRTAR
jgi:hypothetical protein